jgi:hypothetical protein
MDPTPQTQHAQPLEVVEWINTDHPLPLTSLTGKVVVVFAFQMLCPGCVMHCLPQAAKVHRMYPKDEVQVIGLHSVFEHHDIMTIAALKTFISEYGYSFPVAVDKPSNIGPTPITMANYAMRGTPTVILIDKAGKLRFQRFGQLTDMQIGSYIGRLLSESAQNVTEHSQETQQTRESESNESNENNKTHASNLGTCTNNECPR